MTLARLAGALPLAAALALSGDAAPTLLEAAGLIELRVAPDGGAPVRARLDAGAPVTVTARQADWARLRSGAQWGWAVEPKLTTRRAP